MTNTSRMWRWNRFGGMTRDIYAPTEDGLGESVGIDTRFSSSGVRLAHRMETVANISPTGRIYRMVTTPAHPNAANPYVLAFTETGEVWRFRRDGSGGAKVYTDPDGYIFGGSLFNGRLVWATQNHLNSITLDNVGATSWTTYVNASPFIQRILPTSYNPRHMLVARSKLHLASGNVVSTMDDSGIGTLTASALVLPSDEFIVGLGQSGTQIQIYTVNQGYPQSSAKYLWDGVSTEATAKVILSGMPVAAVCTHGHYDSVVVGDAPTLRLMASSGYRFDGIGEFDAYMSHTTSTGISTLARFGDELVIGSSDARLRSLLGSKLACPYTLTSQTSNAYTTTIESVGNTFFAAAVYGGSPVRYGVERLSTSLYAAQGWVSSTSLVLDGAGVMKSPKEIIAAYELPAWTSIELYGAKNQADFTLLATFADTSRTATRLVANQLGALTDAARWQFKALLKTTDPTKTPVFWGLDCLYTTQL